MTERLVVLVTAPDEAEAEALGRGAVEGRWAACASLVAGSRSIFRWEGELRCDTECLMILKTTREKLEGLIAYLVAHHTYEVPEVIALPVVGGHAEYLSWIAEETATEATP